MNSDNTALAIGAAIRDARRAAGMTQQQLAAATGLPQPNISAYERGAKFAGVETLRRIGAALGADYKSLLP